MHTTISPLINRKKHLKHVETTNTNFSSLLPVTNISIDDTTVDYKQDIHIPTSPGQLDATLYQLQPIPIPQYPHTLYTVIVLPIHTVVTYIQIQIQTLLHVDMVG